MRRLSSKGKKGKAGKAGAEEKELGNDSDAQGNGSTAAGVGSDQEESGSEEAKVSGGKKSKRGKRSDQNPNSGNESEDEKPLGGRKKSRGRKRNSKENDNTESNKRKRRSGNSESEQETSGKTEDEEYEVEKVVDCRIFQGVKQYKIRWKGYEEGDTWEPEDELNCSDLIEEYLQEHPDAPKVTGKPAKAGRGKKAGKQSNNETPKQKKSKREVAPVSEEDGQKVYEVEKVLEVHFKKNGEREFLIRWKGFAGEDDSWEPEKNLNCPDLIEKFMKKVEVAKSVSVRELRANPQTTSRYALDSAKGRRSRRNKGKNRATYYNSE